MSFLDGVELVNQSGEAIDTKQALSQNLVAVYFSAHWCAPCRIFTPVAARCLGAACEAKTKAKAQQETKPNVNPTAADGPDDASSDTCEQPDLSVIYVSQDQSPDEFKEYFASMPETWLAVPFENEDSRDGLAETFGVQHLPHLVILKPSTGAIVERNGVLPLKAAGPSGTAALLVTWGMRSSAPVAIAPATGASDDTVDQEVSKADLEMRFAVPGDLKDLTQYFKEQMVTEKLPKEVRDIVLARSVLSDAEVAEARTIEHKATDIGVDADVERFVVRVQTPALALDSRVGGMWMKLFGGKLGGSVNALENWIVAHDVAHVAIENETYRTYLIVREEIEMTQSGEMVIVHKRLVLDGVPSFLHPTFLARWHKESQVIYHLLLGSCDAKPARKVSQDKKPDKSGGYASSKPEVVEQPQQQMMM